MSAVEGMNERGVVKLGSAVPGDDLDMWFDLDSRWDEVFSEPAAPVSSEPAGDVPPPPAGTSPVLESDLMAGELEDAGVDAERWMRIGREQMEAGRFINGQTHPQTDGRMDRQMWTDGLYVQSNGCCTGNWNRIWNKFSKVVK